MRPSAPRRQPEKSARFSGGSTPAGKSVSTVGRKQKSFDQLLGLANAPRVFKLTSWFWIFFCFGAILFSIGVSYVLNASEYDGEFKDWGGTRIYQSNPSRKGDPSSDPSFAAAKNTAVICEGLKYINRNFSNVGSHYQGLHEMFIGFTLIFGSGFFFFCALIAFLYSARMPAKE